jgi:DNA-binding MarR family transcriptional regulator
MGIDTKTQQAASKRPPVAAHDTLLQQLSRTYHELAAAFERHMGMSRARWVILAQLRREEALSQAQLAERLRVDAAAITRQVQQLERDGLVMRWADPEDNRFTLTALTSQGRQTVEELYCRRDSFEAGVTAGLNQEEIATMRRALTQIRENLQGLL